MCACEYLNFLIPSYRIQLETFFKNKMDSIPFQSMLDTVIIYICIDTNAMKLW